MFRRSVSFYLRIALLLFTSILFGAMPLASAASWKLEAQPPRLINGAPVLFQIRPPQKLESLHATWLGHDIAFSFDATHKTWFALAGVSLETAPGTYPFELTGETAAGKTPS